MPSRELSAAILTIKKPGKMSPSGRRAIAGWLKKQAAYFLKYGKEYSDTRFVARYLYR